MFIYSYGFTRLSCRIYNYNYAGWRLYDYFWVSNGAHQGGVVSPIMFIIIDSFVESLHNAHAGTEANAVISRVDYIMRIMLLFIHPLQMLLEK